MIYNIISSIKFVENIESITDIEIMNRFIESLEIPLTSLKIFDDCDINDVSIDESEYNGTIYYSENETRDTSLIGFPGPPLRNIYWRVNINGEFIYQNPDLNKIDYFPLSTLQYILDKFKENGRIARGVVIAYNKNIDISVESYRSICYKIVNSNLIYFKNQTMEQTKHWNNCVKYKNGQTILENYISNGFQNYHANSFVNLILNSIISNTEYDENYGIRIIDALTDCEIYKVSFAYVY